MASLNEKANSKIQNALLYLDQAGRTKRMNFGDALKVFDAAGDKGLSFIPSDSLTVTGANSTFGTAGEAKDFTVYGKMEQSAGEFHLTGNADSSIDATASNLTIGAAAEKIILGQSGKWAEFLGNVKVDEDLVVSGNITVNGTQTILNTVKVEVEDTIIELGKASDGTTVLNQTADMGIEANWADGAAKLAALYFDVSAKEWSLAHDVSEAGGAITPTGDYGQLHLKTLSVQDAGSVSGLGKLTVESTSAKDLELKAAANLVVSVVAGKSLLMNSNKFTMSAEGAGHIEGNLSIAESLVAGKVFSMLGDASIKGALDIRNSAGQVKSQISQAGVSILETSLAVGDIAVGSNTLAIKGDSIFGIAGDSANITLNGGEVVVGGSLKQVYAQGKVRTETAVKLEKKAAMVVPVAAALAAGKFVSADSVDAAGEYTTTECNALGARLPVFCTIGSGEAALPGTFVNVSHDSTGSGEELFLAEDGSVTKVAPTGSAAGDRHVIRAGFAMASGMIFAPAYISQIPQLA